MDLVLEVVLGHYPLKWRVQLLSGTFVGIIVSLGNLCTGMDRV